MLSTYIFICPQGGTVTYRVVDQHVVDSTRSTHDTNKMADLIVPDCIEDEGFDYDIKNSDMVADDMTESGYQEGSETSFGERRDSGAGEVDVEGDGEGEGDSDSGVDGSSGCGSGCADDCPVVSINDAVAYYDDIRPRRRPAPQLNFYHLDIERMAMDAVVQVEDVKEVFGMRLPRANDE
ncbi:hypothetical protein RR46_06501 [Papilio xuthus]|uniref:Uncharacterized protein n=1 Tax=Papilio xuthus TaxID=66420 RepID=A0A194QEH1_PAPXU|nr:hypothetical protein RR46_06501 [Papilio xuthus]